MGRLQGRIRNLWQSTKQQLTVSHPEPQKLLRIIFRGVANCTHRIGCSFWVMFCSWSYAWIPRVTPLWGPNQSSKPNTKWTETSGFFPRFNHMGTQSILCCNVLSSSVGHRKEKTPNAFFTSSVNEPESVFCIGIVCLVNLARAATSIFTNYTKEKSMKTNLQLGDS